MKDFDPAEALKDLDNPELIKQLAYENIEEKTILGIDIYKYSKYPLEQQFYVPVVFEILYNITCVNLIKLESFLFNSYGNKKSDFRKNFISTGDGGFQIFDNPLQAVVFALYFQANLKRFLSGGSTHELLKKLYKVVETYELRYVITHDSIYSYNNNFFGPAIINNARILSKDNLNRLLVDAKTINWFTETINSVENLMDLDKTTFQQTKFFKNFDQSLVSVLFENRGTFMSVDVLKIGQIESKTVTLNIYNLHVQVLFDLKIEKHDYSRFLLTLGNLNTTGIE